MLAVISFTASFLYAPRLSMKLRLYWIWDEWKGASGASAGMVVSYEVGR